jgi:hypothetical protein
MNIKVQLENLVALYVEGACGPTELAKLEALLLEDAESRKYFLEIVLLAEDLGMLGGSWQRRADAGLLSVETLLPHQQKRTVGISLMAAAAVILVSIVPMWTQMAPRRGSESSEVSANFGLGSVRMTAVETRDMSIAASH